MAAEGWDRMSTDEKVDRLDQELVRFIEHYNTGQFRTAQLINQIEHRLKQIEERLAIPRMP
jgi:hypothetical protein